MSAEKLPLTVLLEVHVSRAKACCKAMSRFLLLYKNLINIKLHRLSIFPLYLKKNLFEYLSKGCIKILLV